MNILALDVGTSSVKAAVLDIERAEPVGPVHHVGYELDHPTPEAAEVPADRLWGAVAEAARRATRTRPDVAAVGLSCLTPGLVLLDKDDRPLGPIWVHLDRRSRGVARQAWAEVGPEFLGTTGNRPLPGGISAVCYKQQLLDDSYLAHRVRHYLHVNGWLGYRMTGARAFDPANASFSGLFNTVTDHAWSPRWCDYFEVNPDWLPPVVDGAATLGHVRSDVAAELGVPPGIPMKPGTADTSSAVLAAAMKPGELLHVVGTTQVLATLTSTPKPDPRRLTRLLGVGDAYLIVTHNPVGGVALEWLKQLCFGEQTQEQFFHESFPKAREHPTRVTLDPPYLGGDRLEIEAHRAAFRDLTLEVTRLDLLAAVLNAMVREHGVALRDLGGGEKYSRVILTGGGAEYVRPLIAEYAEADVEFLEEGSLRGVARLFTTG
jgi:xylulokinase